MITNIAADTFNISGCEVDLSEIHGSEDQYDIEIMVKDPSISPFNDYRGELIQIKITIGSYELHGDIIISMGGDVVEGILTSKQKSENNKSIYSFELFKN